MSNLRYKGKPYRGTNVIADRPPSICLCIFMGVGEPMNTAKCDVHEDRKYPCDQDKCMCLDYRPNTVKRYEKHWPLCACGHIAQEHN